MTTGEILDQMNKLVSKLNEDIEYLIMSSPDARGPLSDLKDKVELLEKFIGSLRDELRL